MQHGFTLVELLVVVAIIAVLAALLMPAIALVQEQARASSCRSTQRQLGMSMLIYAQEQDGYLVCNGTTAGAWWQALLPYAGTDAANTSINSVPWRCPEWYRGGRWRTSTNVWLTAIGYGYNHRPGQPQSSVYHGLPVDLTLGPSSSNEYTLASITYQSMRPMAGDSTTHVILNQNSSSFFRAGLLYWTGDPTRHSDPQLQSSAPLANSRANYLFFDGHVESLGEAPVCARMQNPATAP